MTLPPTSCYPARAGNTATKTEQAERLILDLLADGKELASEEIVKAAAEAGISERTVQNAKRNMGGVFGCKARRRSMVQLHQEEAAAEPASCENAKCRPFALCTFALSL